MPLQYWFWINFNKYWNAPAAKFSCCSITKLYLTLNNLMDGSTPGFPVLHYPPEFAQTHVHWVSDTIQHLVLYHAFSSWPQFFPALGSFPMSRLFASGGKSIGVSVSASFQFSSVQSLSRVRLFATPWTAARQASLSVTNSRSSPKPVSIKSVMPSNHLILCCPLLLSSIFPSIRLFSKESALFIRWSKS